MDRPKLTKSRQDGPPVFKESTAALITARFIALAMPEVTVSTSSFRSSACVSRCRKVAGFAFLVALNANHLRMWALCVPAIVGAMHIASWARLRVGVPAGLAPWHVPRSAVISLVAALVVFLLLCANEMFGQQKPSRN